jgi:hypothetical protein
MKTKLYLLAAIYLVSIIIVVLDVFYWRPNG